MKNFTKLIFISTTLNTGRQEPELINWPRWLKGFIHNLNEDRYYNGSIMYRYSWCDKIYYQLEVPSDNCIFCQVIDQRGEFIKWPDNLFQKYLNERTEERIIWRYC